MISLSGFGHVVYHSRCLSVSVVLLYGLVISLSGFGHAVYHGRCLSVSVVLACGARM